MSRRNLIVVHRGPEYQQDFDEIALKVHKINTDITVYHLPGDLDVELPSEAWQYPTLTVSLAPYFRLPIKRGPILRNRPFRKPFQHRVFLAAGLPTPPTAPFRPGVRLDPIQFGELVVIKPTNPDLASYGNGIQLFRRRRLEQMTIADFTRQHLIHRDTEGFIVQRFIDTGPHLPVYRVLTLFAAPLYNWLARDKVPLSPIGGSDAEVENRRVASNTGSFRERFASDEQDVLELGIRVAEVFPDVPLLGSDIIREEKTGALYVLECNPGGNTWHFSSTTTAGIRRQIGGQSQVGARKAEFLGRQRMIDQLGAFDRAAEVLARKTLELAS